MHEFQYAEHSAPSVVAGVGTRVVGGGKLASYDLFHIREGIQLIICMYLRSS